MERSSGIRDHATHGFDVIDSTDLYGDGAGVLNAPTGFYYYGIIPSDDAAFTTNHNTTTYRNADKLGDGSIALVNGAFYPISFTQITVTAGVVIALKSPEK